MTSASSISEPSVRVEKRKLSSLVFLHVANDSFFGFFSPIFPLLIAQMDLSITLVTILSSTFALTGAVGQPIFGYFSDRIRKGWLVALGPILGAFMTLLIYMPNYPSMLLLLLFAGTGSACFHPVASVIATQISGNRKGLGVSIYVAGGRLGMSLGAASATFIVTNWGLEAIPIAGVVGLLFGIPFLFLAPSITGGGKSAPMNFRDSVRSLKTVRRPLIVMWFVNLCRTSVTMMISTFMPLYIVQGGGSLGKGGFSVTLFLLGAAMGGVYGGHLSDRIGRRTVMIGSLLLGTPVLGASFLSAGLLQIILLVMAGAILYASMGVSVTFAQEVAPEHKALVSAFMLGVVWFFGSMILIGVGVLGDAIGILTAFPVASIVGGGIGTALAFRLPRLGHEE